MGKQTRKGSRQRVIEAEKRRKECDGLLNHPDAVHSLKPLRKRRRVLEGSAEGEFLARSCLRRFDQPSRIEPLAFQLDGDSRARVRYENAVTGLALMGPLVARRLRPGMIPAALSSHPFGGVRKPTRPSFGERAIGAVRARGRVSLVASGVHMASGALVIGRPERRRVIGGTYRAPHIFRGAAVIVMHATPEEGVQQHDASGRVMD